MSFTVLVIALSLATSPILAASDLSSVQWKNRVLVLFADRDASQYLEQQRLLEASRAGLSERDMLVLGVTGESVRTLFGNTSGFDVETLRNTIGDKSSIIFEAVLIGKDGGVKQRWTTPVSPESVFEIIDAMPMRADEMRR